MRNARKPSVVIGAPERMLLEEMNAIKDEMRGLGATVSAHRTDTFFGFEYFHESCVGTSHFLLVVDDQEFPYERKMLAVIPSKDVRVAILCLGSCQALSRHTQLIETGHVTLVVTRSFLDNSRKSNIVGHRVPHSLVAEDLVRSSREIARAVLVGWH